MPYREQELFLQEAEVKTVPSYISATEFEREVWAAASAIQEGETRSYSWIAKRIGAPKAFRAVGNALRKNPLPFLIPCHRVVRKDGDIGGFSGGKGMKKMLLKIEAQ